MKKVLLVILAILVLLACIVLLDNSMLFSAEIIAGTNNESVVRPGDTLEFSVSYKILGIHYSKSSALQIQTNSSLCSISDNGSVTVNKDTLTGEEITVNVSYNSIIRKISQTYNYIVKYSLDSSIDDRGVILEPDRVDVLVTKSRSLSKNYVPDDLIKVDVKFLSTYKKMRKEAADALKNLFAAAKKEGYTLYGVSAYRSYDLQKQLYKKFVSLIGLKKANIRVSLPGRSEHQTGLAVDITSKSAVNRGIKFGSTHESKWIENNAYKYGFIIRYPKGKENITGYMYEPWHLRYVGINLAKKIYESGLTFEEYMLK